MSELVTALFGVLMFGLGIFAGIIMEAGVYYARG